MHGSSATAGARHEPWIESERFRLAALARDAALEVPGVLGAGSGPTDTWVTADHGRRLTGVQCLATATGGYDVSLRLTCALLPLIPLGESVAVAVRGAASRNGHRIDDLRIEVADVVHPMGL